MTIGLNPSDVPEPLELKETNDSENGFYNNGGQLIGKIYDSPTHDAQMYVSYRKKAKHYHRNNNSYAIDTRVVKDLDKQWPDVEYIAIFVIDEGRILLFDLDTYLNAKEENQGFGYQRFPETTEAHTVYEEVDNFDGDYYPDHINIE